jgi:hypothetical protein
MKRPILQALTGALIGIAFVTARAELRTNEMLIGGTPVETKVVDAKLIGQKLVGISNRVFLRKFEVMVDGGLPVVYDTSTNTYSKPSLEFVLHAGDGPFSAGSGFHGLMRKASDWKTPALAQTNRVDIMSSVDRTKIVVMVCDNGPIYSSTDSGMTWRVINTPGKYEFPLTSTPEHGGFFAEATIHPSLENQSSTNSTPPDWYVVGSASDGSNLVITSDSSQPAPVLSIKQSGGGVVVSWPTAFGSFALQATSDLNSTNWVGVTNSIDVSGGENQVFIASPIGNSFFRLRPQ